MFALRRAAGGAHVAGPVSIIEEEGEQAERDNKTTDEIRQSIGSTRVTIVDTSLPIVDIGVTIH
jgi:hypothetical protein